MNRRLASVCDSSWAIRVQDVVRSFPLQTSGNTVFRALSSYLFNGCRNGHAESNGFYALRDITFDISKGEKVAIVGDNGAGKTTLLKVIAGLYRQTAGLVYTSGRMVLLRGMAIGMLDELSATENLFLYSSIYGVDREKIKENFAEIFEWAELQSFTHARLATLSTGMKARLAFSALRHLEAEIFLLDETFGSADKHFAKKYEQVFENQRKSDKTFLIATHDLNFAKMFCTKTLWLNKGRQMAFGATDEVLEHYMAANT